VEVFTGSDSVESGRAAPLGDRLQAALEQRLQAARERQAATTELAAAVRDPEVARVLAAAVEYHADAIAWYEQWLAGAPFSSRRERQAARERAEARRRITAFRRTQIAERLRELGGGHDGAHRP
jgi:hypothetical protein